MSKKVKSQGDNFHDFYSEWKRLASFANFPVNGPSAIALARSGFYYLDEDYRTRCFSCDVTYILWKFNDVPNVVHARISPNCRHVNGCDPRNIPIMSENTKTDINAGKTSKTAECSTKCGGPRHLPEGDHHSSDSTFLSHQESSSLSQASINDIGATNKGFLVESLNDDHAQTTRTHLNVEETSNTEPSNFASNITFISAKNDNATNIANSEYQQTTKVNTEGTPCPESSAHDNATSRDVTANLFHGNHSGKALTNNGSSKPESANGSPIVGAPTIIVKSNDESDKCESTEIAFVGSARPRYPEYAIKVKRTQTFDSWTKSQSAELLAMAGFFRADDLTDLVRCFFCGGGMKSWKKGDNPWIEHAKWFPRCQFVRQNMGDSLVSRAKSMRRDKNNPEILKDREAEYSSIEERLRSMKLMPSSPTPGSPKDDPDVTANSKSKMGTLEICQFLEEKKSLADKENVQNL